MNTARQKNGKRRVKPDRQRRAAPQKRRFRLDTVLTAVGLFISFSLFVTTQLNGMEERISARIDSRIDSLETNFNARFDSLEGRVDAIDGRLNSMDGSITSLETGIRSSLENLNSRVGYLEGRAGTGNDVPAVPPN